MVGKPKFIASQRLLRLNCTAGEELAYLKPERFRARRMKQRGDETTADADYDSWEGAWDEVDDQDRFLIEPGHQHLCITIGAGIGKTRSAQQTRYLRQVANPRELAILLDVSHLPHVETPDQFGRERQFDREFLDLEQSTYTSLVAAILREAASDSPADGHDAWTMKDCPGPVARSLIHRKIRQREFTLIVDGLDQIDMQSDRAAKAVVSGLRQFLSHYPRARCVVTGRPWSVQHHWHELFGHPQQQGRWAFAQIDEFNDAEVTEYLGQDRKAALDLLEADLLAVPRFLERLRQITPQRLATLRTGAEVYWESLCPMLESGCAKQQAGLKIDQAIPLLALLAFQMTTNKKAVRVRPGREFQACLDAALSRGEQVLRLDHLDRTAKETEFKRRLGGVAGLTIFLATGRF
ncbi:MAG: hypothetical protein ABI614_13035, partial [Planctomycetota bacterium]